MFCVLMAESRHVLVNVLPTVHTRASTLISSSLVSSEIAFHHLGLVSDCIQLPHEDILNCLCMVDIKQTLNLRTGLLGPVELSWEWWHMPVTPASRKQVQKDQKLQTSLGDIVGSHL